MADSSEMACVYAALILHDDGIPVTEDKIKTLTEAAGVKIEPYWPSMFARLVETVSMDDLISNIGSAPVAAPAGAPAGQAAEETKEEEKEESEEEEEEEMEFDLFD